MSYDHAQFERDLNNPNMPHITNRERFKQFYNQLGELDVQDTQRYRPERMDFIKPYGKILELGCHWGFDLIYWAHQGFEGVGVDVSETLIAKGNKKLKAEPPEVRQRVTLIQGWIEEFEPPEQYHTVVLTETLEHVIEPLPIMQKAAECLSTQGLLYITVPDHRWGNYSHVRGITAQELNELAEKSGLYIDKWIHTIPRNTAAIARLKPKL